MDIPDTLPPGQYAVYALVDPTDGTVHYVGQTHSPRRRLEQHLGARHYQGEKGDWLRRLRQQGQQPLMRILELVTGEKAALEKEQEWIRHFLEQQTPLLNAQAQPRQKKTCTPPLPVAQECRMQTIIAGAPPILVVRLPDGRTGATLRSLCVLLDLARHGQMGRIRRSRALSSALLTVTMATSGGPQATDVLLDWAIPIWAAGLHISRLPEKKQALALILQRDAFGEGYHTRSLAKGEGMIPAPIHE